MYIYEGICDWCKKLAMLKKPDYIDGKSHFSCQECNVLATLDVRQFNLAETESQKMRQFKND
jgi:hypothetical protein